MIRIRRWSVAGYGWLAGHIISQAFSKAGGCDDYDDSVCLKGSGRWQTWDISGYIGE